VRHACAIAERACAIFATISYCECEIVIGHASS